MISTTLEQPRWRASIAHVAQIGAVGLGFVIPLSNSATTIFSTLVILLCLLYMDKITWSRVLKNPACVAAIAMVLLTLLDSTFSIGTHKDITLAVRKSLRLLYLPLLMPLFVESRWRHYGICAYLVAVFISVLAALFFFWPVFKDSIYTSLFISYAIFILLHYSVDYKEHRGITIPAVIFLSFYLFFIGTGGVGQLLCLLLFGLFFVQRFGINKKMLGATVVCSGLLIFGLLTIPSSFMQRQMVAINEIKDYMRLDESKISPDSSMGMRLVFAHNSVQMIKLKPIIGFGSGAFKEAYAHYAPEFHDRHVARPNPHNQYLLTWAELGLPGLSLLLFMFWALYKQFFAYKQLEGYLGVGLVLTMVIGCSMNSWLLDFASCFFFVFFAGLFMGASDLG